MKETLQKVGFYWLFREFNLFIINYFKSDVNRVFPVLALRHL